MIIRRHLKSLWCLVSCVCPCGALDVVRVVRANGRVDEIDGDGVRAGDFLSAHPVISSRSRPRPRRTAAFWSGRWWLCVAEPGILLRGYKNYI
uniref:Secreted protein n=1 Tax=Kalanchoe fedtschenkoi TaxID=63787 RepID=A0A7N0SWF0_KALFE